MPACLQAAVQWFLHLIFDLFGLLLGLVGSFFDESIRFSLNTQQWPWGSIAAAWTIIRDVCNVGFVFALLYIAISTILRIGSYGKRMLATLIVVAILVNFSLFAAEVVIDSGNMLAVGIYNQLLTQSLKLNGNTQQSISAVFENGLQLQTLLNKTQLTKIDFKTMVVGEIGSIVLINIAIFVFLAAGILFIMRTVALIFLMVLSPVAFVSYAFPGMSGFGSTWVRTLIGESFYAPAYLLMLYLTGILIFSNSFSDPRGIAGGVNNLMSGNPMVPGAFEVFVHYAIVAGFLLASVMISRYFSTWTGGMAQRYAKTAFGVGAGAVVGGTLAGAGFAGRTTIGRAANRLAKSDKVKGWTESNSRLGAAIGRVTQRAATATSKASFDARNGRIGAGIQKAYGVGGVRVNLGKGQQGGFAQTLKDSTARRKEYADSLSKEGRERYVEALRSGGIYKSVFGVATGSGGFAASKRAADQIEAPQKLKELRAQFFDGTHPDLGGRPGLKELKRDLQRLRDQARDRATAPPDIADRIVSKEKEVQDTQDDLDEAISSFRKKAGLAH